MFLREYQNIKNFIRAARFELRPSGLRVRKLSTSNGGSCRAVGVEQLKVYI